MKREMSQMIKDVGLPHKRQEKSCNLSGKLLHNFEGARQYVLDLERRDIA